MRWQIWSLQRQLLVSTLLTLFWLNPALAQSEQNLTRAEVYKLSKIVELLLQNQTQRPAKLKDVVVPKDAVRTGVSSEAQLFFNDKSLIRVDQSSVFRFQPGLRRFKLPNLIAQNETIFKLDNGTALILSPPGSVGTAVETPQTQVTILASTSAPSDKLYPPAQLASAVMVIHNQERNTTQVFALTDGDIKITDQQGKKAVALRGGQTVAVKNGIVGNPQEFDLPAFYQNITLAAGLGPGQEKIIAQESPPVQETLKFVRVRTLAALKNQAQRFKGFTRTFLADALNGTEGDLNPRPTISVRIVNPQVVTGTFYKTRGNNAVFIPDNNPNSPTNISVDFDKGTVTINGNTGVSNKAGLSGNNASGSVINANGQITQIEVFAVNGEAPQDNVPYRGSLTTGIARDR
ncbi:FecR domain-containing protein [Nostoc sp. TCL26-01]|uniref:FecR domain-containing protein n=1 Tax=Nostoc sp. TCL26-01 TaxID=2576904 RepID=UPI0015BC7614|nr:FecR domain-containing protein [Nostoc sp. TCL26-01]QLE58395.1 FecR domain-containing protein [Nostoc sp. TCL26-01]